MVILMNKLKQLREEKGMKQLELAAILSVSQNTISRYECGERDLGTDTIAILCRIFGCTADYLLGISSQRTTQISDEDAALVEAYHAAPENVRQSIEVLLRPFMEAGTLSALSDGQEGERHG